MTIEFNRDDILVKTCDEVEALLAERPDLLPQAVEHLLFLVRFIETCLEGSKQGHDGWANLYEESAERLGGWHDKAKRSRPALDVACVERVLSQANWQIVEATDDEQYAEAVVGPYQLDRHIDYVQGQLKVTVSEDMSQRLDEPHCKGE